MKQTSLRQARLPAALLLASGIVAGPSARAGTPASPPEVVQRVSGPAGHTVWQILRPNVTEPLTNYPQITFAPGASVTVMASGCVQRGGKGQTWYRYVDPVGDGSTKLYFGSISIPGATQGLEPLKPSQPTVYAIPADVNLSANQMHLALGYADNGYSDNGYYSHDTGPSNQCWKVDDASLTIDIGPTPPTIPTPQEVNYNFTIESITIDRLRSKPGHTDTDTLTMGSIINGTPSQSAQIVLGDLSQGVHGINKSVLLEQVRPGDRLDIVYTIVNGGSKSQEEIESAVSDAVSQVAKSIPIVGQFVAIAAEAMKTLFPILNPDCEGVVVAGSLPATGEDIARWLQYGTYTRTLSFPGSDSANGCGSNSFYDVTYSISPSKSDAPPQSFVINVPSRKLTKKAAGR